MRAISNFSINAYSIFEIEEFLLKESGLVR